MGKTGGYDFSACGLKPMNLKTYGAALAEKLSWDFNIQGPTLMQVVQRLKLEAYHVFARPYVTPG